MTPGCYNSLINDLKRVFIYCITICIVISQLDTEFDSQGSKIALQAMSLEELLVLWVINYDLG